MPRRHTLQRSLVALAFAAAVVPVSGALAAAATPPIHLYDLAKHDAAEPRTFLVTQHDGLSGLRWFHWGAWTATGRGTMEINTCQPNCATGRMRTLPDAMLQVRGVRVDQGRRYYRQYRIIDRAFTSQERDAYSRWTKAYVPSDFGALARG